MLGKTISWALPIAAMSGLMGIGFVLYHRFVVAPGPELREPALVSIRRGDSLRTIAGKLEEGGVVRSALGLRLYARATGKAQEVKAGDYAFPGGERVAEVMRRLVAGDFGLANITIPEGQTVHQIAERLESAGLACDSDIEREARNGAIVRALGLGELGAEGYLFPATYRFSPLAGQSRIVETMLARFFEIWTPAVEKRRYELGLSTRELVTLASIIEKEAKAAGDRPLIAGVFYNRLRLHMPLQSDPTAQYSFEGVTAAPLEAVHSQSAFNTYDFAGLPPGPIANPGWSSINAALYPAATGCLYFVARADGTHIFSRTFAEHERAIAQIKRESVKQVPAAMAAGSSHDPRETHRQ
jgi:UPF0755 protein